MNFDLLSDVHQDISWKTVWPETGSNDTIILPGDMGNSFAVTDDVLTYFSRRYEHVLFVDGNHEFYGVNENLRGIGAPGYVLDFTHQANVDLFSSGFESHGPSNCHYLTRGPWIAGDTAVVGVNGWYGFRAPGAPREEQIQEWRRTNNDARQVFLFDEKKALVAWESDFMNLRSQLESVNANDDVEKVVVVTHTLPHQGALLAKYKPAANGAFYNGFFDLLETKELRKVKVWVFGHTHYKFDFRAEDIRFLAWPRGYGHEKTGRNSVKSVSVF